MTSTATGSGVEPICDLLKDAGPQIVPSTNYTTKTRPASARAVLDAEPVVDLTTAHKANLGVYVHARSTPSSTVRASRLPPAPSSG